MSKRIKEGDLVEVYRIPRKCDYWIAGMEELLYQKAPLENWTKTRVIFQHYIIPRSCVRRVKEVNHDL